jgi:hypothetical protein
LEAEDGLSGCYSNAGETACLLPRWWPPAERFLPSSRAWDTHRFPSHVTSRCWTPRSIAIALKPPGRLPSSFSLLPVVAVLFQSPAEFIALAPFPSNSPYRQLCHVLTHLLDPLMPLLVTGIGHARAVPVAAARHGRREHLTVARRPRTTSARAPSAHGYASPPWSFPATSFPSAGTTAAGAGFPVRVLCSNSRRRTSCDNRNSSRGLTALTVTQINSELQGFSFSFYVFS